VHQAWMYIYTSDRGAFTVSLTEIMPQYAALSEIIPAIFVYPTHYEKNMPQRHSPRPALSYIIFRTCYFYTLTNIMNTSLLLTLSETVPPQQSHSGDTFCNFSSKHDPTCTMLEIIPNNMTQLGTLSENKLLRQRHSVPLTTFSVSVRRQKCPCCLQYFLVVVSCPDDYNCRKLCLLKFFFRHDGILSFVYCQA
jgi:hypothetical protein